jgi:hypothetical protein
MDVIELPPQSAEIFFLPAFPVVPACRDGGNRRKTRQSSGMVGSPFHIKGAAPSIQ